MCRSHDVTFKLKERLAIWYFLEKGQADFGIRQAQVAVAMCPHLRDLVMYLFVFFFFYMLVHVAPTRAFKVYRISHEREWANRSAHTSSFLHEVVKAESGKKGATQYSTVPRASHQFAQTFCLFETKFLYLRVQTKDSLRSTVDTIFYYWNAHHAYSCYFVWLLL